MNETKASSSLVFAVEDYYIVGILSCILCLIILIICLFVLILICQKKTRLHTVYHLLICNTCIASIIYSTVTINNYIYLIFIQWDHSDLSCRFRAYFSYISVSGEMYSYLIQSLSRLFFFKYSLKYRWLVSFKSHYILICIQWTVVFLITLPSLLTNDILFGEFKFCLIPLKSTLHLFCATLAYYIIPFVTAITIYMYIYYCVKKIKRNTTSIMDSYQSHKRDLELLRNIVILIIIYLVGGFPTIIFLLIPNKYLYLTNLVTECSTVTIAKICIILLDRELRNVIKNILRRHTAIVMPFNTVQQMTRRE